ncbi:MAG: YlxM family DNA-binding protein [Clostridia bacterium]|nr:YlxM family DNA-binding protein [Clostridia bacterium]
MEKNLQIGLLCDFYGKMLTEKQLSAIIMYYDDDLSLAEIAVQTGITRQGVRDCIKKGEAILLEMEEKLGLAEKFTRLREGMDEIRAAAEDIREQNSRGMVNVVIADAVKTIVRVSDQVREDGI